MENENQNEAEPEKITNPSEPVPSTPESPYNQGNRGPDVEVFLGLTEIFIFLVKEKVDKLFVNFELLPPTHPTRNRRL